MLPVSAVLDFIRFPLSAWALNGLQRLPVHEAKAVIDPPEVGILRAGARPVEGVGSSFSGAFGGADEPGVFPGMTFGMTILKGECAPVAVKNGKGINPLKRRNQ